MIEQMGIHYHVWHPLKTSLCIPMLWTHSLNMLIFCHAVGTHHGVLILETSKHKLVVHCLLETGVQL